MKRRVCMYFVLLKRLYTHSIMSIILVMLKQTYVYYIINTKHHHIPRTNNINLYN